MRTLAEVTKDITEARSTNQDWESVIQPLYEEQKEIIKHDRDRWEDSNLSLEIDCPIHITHKAHLFIHGHRYAGMWECPESGDTDSCPHFDIETEEIEDNDGHKSRIYVCAYCRVAVEGDPDADAAESDDE